MGSPGEIIRWGEYHLRYGSVVRIRYAASDITAMILGVTDPDFVTDEGTSCERDLVTLLVLDQGDLDPLSSFYPLLGTATTDAKHSIIGVIER